jgi:hypothetical protein
MGRFDCINKIMSPVIQLILPTVTTLTVIVHVRRDGMERFVTSILMNV